jgi:hypothetical protein
MQARRLFGLALAVVTAGTSIALAGHASAKPHTLDGIPARRAVPVLMYHVIADPPASATAGSARHSR